MPETDQHANILAPISDGQNPLLENWDASGGVPPFSRISAEHFLPAYARALAEHEAQIASIADGQKTISVKIDRLAEGQAATQASVQYAGQEMVELRARVNALEVRR